MLSEKELCDLTLAAAAINAWNRLSIAIRLVPGSYQLAKKKACRDTRTELSDRVFSEV